MRFPDLLAKLARCEDEVRSLQSRLSIVEKDIGRLWADVRAALPEAEQYRREVVRDAGSS